MVLRLLSKSKRDCYGYGILILIMVVLIYVSGCSQGEPANTDDTAVQLWEIVDQHGQTATLTVDSSGYFTGSGWVGGGSAGIPYYDIDITNGKMSATLMTFDISASYNNGEGSISGSGTGTLNSPFPNATFASGTESGTISDPLGTRSFSSTWTATRISDGGASTPLEDFDFDVDVSPHSVSIMQGETATIDVTVKLVRGDPQSVILTTTGWDRTVNISARFAETTIIPTKTTILYVETTCDTPPDEYLFTVRGETKGTFHTSVDAVNLEVKTNPACVSSPSSPITEAAEERNNQGVTYLNEGRLDEAILEFSRAIEIDSNYAQAYNNRGLAYYRRGECDQAITDYTRAIELDPNCALVYNNRGLAYQEGKGEYDQAIADCTRAIELDYNYASAYNNRGFTYYKRGEYDRAIADCTRAIELDPSFALAYNNRGIAYYGKGEYDKAIADYTTAIELQPSFSWPYYNRGLVYKLQNKKLQAIADFEKFLDLSEDLSLTQEAERILEELRS